eukprot:1159399-Pelagomonas_calceolata.AAC.8
MNSAAVSSSARSLAVPKSYTAATPMLRNQATRRWKASAGDSWYSAVQANRGGRNAQANTCQGSPGL